MIRRLILVLVVVGISGTLTALAQSGGQFCVRSFEDRNGNGQFDTGEPLLNSGIAANLQDADGLIVASALLSESPIAARGLICFQFLEAGDYALQITSADYTPTTDRTLTATIAEGALPTVVDYGGERISVDAPPGAVGDNTGLAALQELTQMSPEEQQSLVQRLVLSGAGSLVMMLLTALIGVILYYTVIRARAHRQQPAYSDPRYATGTMSMSSTSTLPPVPSLDDEDTGRFHPPIFDRIPDDDE